MLQPICALTRTDIQQLMAQWGQPSYRSDQLIKWIYDKNIPDFTRISNFPKDLTQRLTSRFSACSLTVTDRQTSTDNTATKYLFCLHDNKLIEGVAISENKRFTLCVSSQAGCAFSCGFCASAKSGLLRHLTVAEIIDQIRIMCTDKKMTNLVFMGSGEPLEKFDVFRQSYETITAPWGFALGQRKITVSTAGYIPGIKNLIDSNLRPKLALSLHSALDEKRTSLMPINKKYPVRKLLDTCRKYAQISGRKITMEYIIIPGFNNYTEDIKAMTDNLTNYPAKINLIPLNPIDEFPYRSPTRHEVHTFYRQLLDTGLEVTVRWSKGDTISAACGQLRAQHG